MPVAKLTGMFSRSQEKDQAKIGVLSQSISPSLTVQVNTDGEVCALEQLFGVEQYAELNERALQEAGGPMPSYEILGLRNVTVLRSNGSLILSCAPTTLEQHYMVNRNLQWKKASGQKTLYEQLDDQGFVHGTELMQVNGGENHGFPYLPNVIGIAVAVITLDRKLILLRRKRSYEGLPVSSEKMMCPLVCALRKDWVSGTAIRLNGALNLLGNEFAQECGPEAPTCMGMIYLPETMNACLLYRVCTQARSDELIQLFRREMGRDLVWAEAFDLDESLIRMAADSQREWFNSSAMAALFTAYWESEANRVFMVSNGWPSSPRVVGKSGKITV